MTQLKPVIASDIDEYKKLIKDHLTVFIFPDDDPNILVNTILDIIDNKGLLLDRS